MKPCPYCGEDLDEVAITVGTLNAPAVPLRVVAARWPEPS